MPTFAASTLTIVLSFFRSNQFFVSIPLALYVVLVHLGALMGAVQPPASPAESGLLYQSWFAWTSNQAFYSAVGAILLLVFQAISVNMLADEFRLMGERSWFPGFFYALTASAFPEFLFISAPLVAATFVPFSLWSIYKAFQKPNVTGAIFDAAFWIAVASLFYPPALLLLIAAFAGIEVVRVFRLKERFVFLIGVVVPLFLGWLWYFWMDRGGDFRQAHFGQLFQWYRFDAVLDVLTLLKTALVVLLSLLFLLGLGSLYRRKGNQAQKFVTVLYWFMLLGAVSSLFRPEWRWEHLLLPVSAMAILLSFTFQNFRNKLWAELWHLGILAFVLFLQFADFFLQHLSTL